jgi:hypothetical protein
MPLIPNDDQMSLPDVRGSLPAPTAPDMSSTGDLLGAAFRRQNLVGTLYERAMYPAPEAPAKPGFDPEVSVPKGAEDHAQIFAGALNEQDIQWREQQYQREQIDKRIIDAHGGWGVAATMLAGATDPLTLASMAIPIVGETRLAQAGIMAGVAGVTTAAQEGVRRGMEVSGTNTESALNIAGSMILGGIIGAAIRPHVPVSEFQAAAAKIDESFRNEGAQPMGPIDGRQSIIPETHVEVAPPHPESGKAAEPGGRADVPKEGKWIAADKPIWEMSADELHAHADKLDSESVDTLTSIFGNKKDATKFHRLANSERDSDYAASEKMVESLPEDKQRLIEQWDTGGGLHAINGSELRDLEKAVRSMHAVGSPEELAERLKHALTNIGDATDPSLMKTKEMRALMETKAAHEVATENGWDLKQISEQAIKSAASRFSDPNDAEFMLGRFLKEPEVTTPHGPTPLKIGAAEGGESVAKSEQPKAALPDVPQAIGELHVNPEAESTAGAAQASNPTLRGETIARGAETLSNTLGRVSPGGRLMNSPSIESRKLLQELANLPETTEKNWQGASTASPIERELWKYDGVHHEGMQARAEQWKAYKERMAGLGQKTMTRQEFYESIAHAMRRGDQHPVPEVAAAAKKTREIEFDPLKERAIKAGLLPEGVTPKGAMSYLMRQYDTEKIRANLGDWLKLLREGFQKQGVDAAEAADIAHSVTRNIMGSERGTMDWKVLDDVVPKSGQMKERTLNLPDEVLEPYLNSDIDHVAHSYLRSMAPEVEMTERFGSRDMKDQISAVHDDYARMIERAPDNASKEELSKHMEADLRDLTAVRDRLYGIYGAPKDASHFAVRAGRLLRSVNAARLLGAATLAHFPDIANVMMRYGLGNTMAAIGKVLTSPEAFNLTRSEAKRMGAGLDMSMNATAAMLGDYANHSQWGPQRFMNRLSRAFTIATLETPLITAVQQLTSTMAQDAIVRAAQKVAGGGAIADARMAAMAAAGIDRDMLGRIAAQHEQFGAKVNGLHFGMSDQWADKEAARVFESAILRDAHSVTLRPGAGDTPLFMSTEWGKALRQFTTFGYAAQRSVVNPLMQGLAHGDPRAAQALFALAAAGTLSYVSKQKAAGQPIEPFDSPRFALEVLDKSNLMGWTSDLVFPALWTMGFKNLSRWSDRDPVETIGGPVVGTVFSTYGRQLPGKLIAPLRDDDSGQKGISRADLHFMRRLMPAQNLWYLRNGINSLEDATGDAFDLPGKSNADRAAELASTAE